MTLLDRRGFLKSAPAAAVAGTAATVSDASEGAVRETPVMQAFREWQDYFLWLEGPATKGMPDIAFDQACRVRHRLEDRLFGLRSETGTDVLAKIIAFTFNGEEIEDDGGTWSRDILAEAKATVEKALGNASPEPDEEADDPLPALFTEWREADRAWETELIAQGEDTPATDRLLERRSALGEKIATAEPTTLKGALAQLEWFNLDNVDFWSCKLSEAASKNALAAMRRLVGAWCPHTDSNR